jgi:SAM-dependent methyltransferase
MIRKTERPGVRAGYDLWAEAYDTTPNPLVALDRRITPALLAPRPGERILDAACGTGAHLRAMAGAGARPVGLDLSFGMLRVARRQLGAMPLVQADLQRELPIRRGSCDAVLCALVGEHLEHLDRAFRACHEVLEPGGRLLFSVFHPEAAAAGLEANFEQGGVEYRLGAVRHAIADYQQHAEDAGFRELQCREFCGDPLLAEQVPAGRRYVGRRLLLVLQGRRVA